MTRFKKEHFNYSGGYLTYQNRFVARFKYVAKSRASFQNFLIKNFTVEEYFDRLKTEAPLVILESKGYFLPHIKKLLQSEGYPLTREGVEQYLRNSIAH